MSSHQLLKQLVADQMEAALAMLNDCVEKCPEQHWDGVIGKYSFWQVVYHTLCFVDLYLSPGEAAYTARPEFHPLGMKEFEAEYPSRRFTREEMLRYMAICREKITEIMMGETERSLAGESGFSWLSFSRAEAHVYNMRHIQHHTGQLSAFLRRAGTEPKWVRAGWKVAGK